MVFVGLDLLHGGSVEVDPVCVVDDVIQDDVGEGGFVDDVVPLGDGDLAGNQASALFFQSMALRVTWA